MAMSFFKPTVINIKLIVIPALESMKPFYMISKQRFPSEVLNREEEESQIGEIIWNESSLETNAAADDADEE